MTRGTMTHACINAGKSGIQTRRTALVEGLVGALGVGELCAFPNGIAQIGAISADALSGTAAPPSPVLAAVAAHREAEAAIAAAVLAHAKAQERDAPEAPALRAAAEAACDRGAAVLAALCALTPRTVEEAGAVASHYATLCDAQGAEGMGAWLLEALAVALGARPASDITGSVYRSNSLSNYQTRELAGDAR